MSILCHCCVYMSGNYLRCTAKYRHCKLDAKNNEWFLNPTGKNEATETFSGKPDL
jgi:hypothetical protein